MNFFEEKAWAKLNLSLDVTRKRDDGYHEMSMVMQTASLYDDVCVTLTESGFISSSNLSFIPNDDRNLAVKAAKMFFTELGISGGAKIDIYKRIPVGSGMGGGSSDAAAVLRCLNRLYDMPFDRQQLETIGSKVGSDVPFCINGGTQLAEGKGEILSPLSPLPDCKIVICKPDFSISTPELFRKLDSVQVRCHPDTAGIIACLDNSDLKGIARRMFNVFEDIPDRRHTSISAIRRIILDCGALGSIMTGSGSAVFGIFDSRQKAENAYELLRKQYKFCYIAENKHTLDV